MPDSSTWRGRRLNHRRHAIRLSEAEKIPMSVQENVQTVKDFFAATGRGDSSEMTMENRLARHIEDSGFRDDVLRGLSGHRRSVPSRWLYDDRGSELFEEITRLEEYYPTRTEAGILREAAKPIGAFVWPRPVVIEYGAGAAVKTALLLAALDRPAEYLAVDLAGDFMSSSVARLGSQFSGVKVGLRVADFTRDFDLPDGLGAGPRLGFFPGSTLGNLCEDEAVALLRRMRRQLGKGGRAIIGIDLRKGVDRLLPAYDDREGVTAAFNLNLLERMNRELGANFQSDAFRHEARWNPEEFAVEMHIVSLRSQVVTIADFDFDFGVGDSIHTESSRKYDAESFARLAELGGWNVAELWTDAERLFSVFGLVATKPAKGD
jgi:dimethylhistidine N-methyltransferase